VSSPSALVIAGPGTNRDRDLALALELAGADPTIVLATEVARHPDLLQRARLLAVAGGFSYGDALGAGRMLALDLNVGLGDALREFVASGRPVIGICNGFQVLTRTKLLPGALGHNAHGRFECRWVVLEPTPRSRCLWTRGIEDPIHCPIAHGEGRYVHPDPDSLVEAGQVALRYRSTNPNGSVADIAGVCNAAGNVLGLMPHPENFVVGRQHPHYLHGGGLDHLGLRLFQNGVAAAAEM
jgi:phosphoribosylformylglycinamidine synthase subunit PurQ / glutaminase